MGKRTFLVCKGRAEPYLTPENSGWAYPITDSLALELVGRPLQPFEKVRIQILVEGPVREEGDTAW